jgi:hypothetical protein
MQPNLLRPLLLLLLLLLQVLEVVKQLGPFSPAELQDSNLGEVLDSWREILQLQGEGVQVVLQPWQLLGAGQRQPWPAVSVWYGLKVLLGLLEVSRGGVLKL